MINLLHFTVSTLFQLDANGKRIEMMQAVIRASQLQQLAAVFNSLPLMGRFTKPVYGFVQNRFLTRSGNPVDAATKLQSHALLEDPIGLTANLRETSAIQIAGRILDVRKDEALMNLAREFVSVWIPALGFMTLLSTFFAAYIASVSLVNIILRVKQTNEANIVCGAVFIHKRLTLVVPLLPLQPSIMIRVPYQKRWIFLLVTVGLMHWLGLEIVLMSIFALTKNISLSALQAATLNLAFADFIREESMEEVVKIVKFYFSSLGGTKEKIQQIAKATASVSGVAGTIFAFSKKLFGPMAGAGAENLVEFGTGTTIPFPAEAGIDLSLPNSPTNSEISLRDQGPINPEPNAAASPFGDASDFPDTDWESR